MAVDPRAQSGSDPPDGSANGGTAISIVQCTPTVDPVDTPAPGNSYSDVVTSKEPASKGSGSGSGGNGGRVWEQEDFAPLEITGDPPKKAPYRDVVHDPSDRPERAPAAHEAPAGSPGKPTSRPSASKAKSSSPPPNAWRFSDLSQRASMVVTGVQAAVTITPTTGLPQPFVPPTIVAPPGLQPPGPLVPPRRGWGRNRRRRH